MIENIDEVGKQRLRSERRMQLVFAVVSLAVLTLGLAINWLAARAGLPRDVIETAAFGMLLTAVAHAAALYLWRR